MYLSKIGKLWKDSIMLSLERCREILGDKTISDFQTEKLREALYALVENIVDEYISSCDKM